MEERCVIPTVKHGGGGVMVCFFLLLVTLSVIYLEFKALHSAAIRHTIWFELSGTIIRFSTGQ
jgi:hypothetical protein